ncbi:MAG: CrcB family protein [Vicingaceae bacterium]
MNTWLAIFIGGGLGSLTRYTVSVLSLRFLHYQFPWGTFISNMLACLLLALFLFAFKGRLDSQPLWRFLIVTGFCGAFSTFSTLSFETYELFRNNHSGLALANLIISIVFGLVIMLILLKDVHIAK